MNVAGIFFWRSSTRLSLLHRNISVSTVVMGKIPDRWEDYEAVGKVIAGTRFISFKVPLNANISRNLPADVKRFMPDDLPNFIKQQNRELGIVIDLTNTTRYYRQEDILKHGIEYQKIFTEGHMVPSSDVQNTFFQTVDDFLSSNADNDRVIGVHCTHGLNRTGYLVCRYMIDRMNFKADDAIRAFNEARGHDMERQNYLSDLRGEPNSDLPSPSKDRRGDRKRTTSTNNCLEDAAEGPHSEKRRTMDNSHTRPSRNNDQRHGYDRGQSWQNSQSYYGNQSRQYHSYSQHPQHDYNNDGYDFARQPRGYGHRQDYNAFGNSYDGSWTNPHGYNQYDFASNDFPSHAYSGGGASFHHRGGRSHGQQYQHGWDQHDPRPQYAQGSRNHEAERNTRGSDRHYKRSEWRGNHQS